MSERNELNTCINLIINAFIHLLIVIGVELCPSPKMLVAKTVTVISVTGGHNDDEISNVC